MTTDPNVPSEAPGSTQPRDLPADYERGEDQPHRTRVLVVVVTLTVLLIGTGIWLSYKIADMRRTQDCLLSGRSNCAPLDLGTSGR